MGVLAELLVLVLLCLPLLPIFWLLGRLVRTAFVLLLWPLQMLLALVAPRG